MEEVRGKIKVQVQSVNVIKVYSMLVCKNHYEAHYLAFMLLKKKLYNSQVVVVHATLRK